MKRQILCGRITLVLLLGQVVAGQNQLLPIFAGGPHANIPQFNQPNGAVFTRVGTVYTGLAYGHIVMRYNLTSITHRTSQLDEILRADTEITIPKKATISDRYFLNWTKAWMTEDIRETVDKVNEALHTTRRPLRRWR